MTDEQKEWLTAGEIAAMKVPGFPHSHPGVRRYVLEKGIHLDPNLCRKRKGTSGVEYHRSIILPAFDDHLNWLTASEIIDLNIPGLPTREDELRAAFRLAGIEDDALRFRRYGQGSNSLYHRSVIEEYGLDRDNWFDATEILRMQLPGFPRSRDAIIRRMRRPGVIDNPRMCRPRQRSGGGFEFHVDALPPEAKERRREITRSESRGPGARDRLERRPLGRLVETFPSATEIRLDLSRPKSLRLIVRIRALSRVVSDEMEGSAP